MRVMSPAYNCVEVDTQRGRAKMAKDGSYDLHPSDAKKLVAEGGFLPSLQRFSRKSEGYRCVECGFGTWFTVCSRCGGECFREADA